MVRDPMDVHNAFLASFENVLRIDNAVVPVRFFNPQPKLKPVPVYPEIVVQVQLPTPGRWFGWGEEHGTESDGCQYPA